MAGLNPNFSRSPVYSPNQNSYSPMANAAKPPPDASRQGGGARVPGGDMPVSSLVSPSNLQPGFSPSGLVPVPPSAQNFNYPSPQAPPGSETSLKPHPSAAGFSNHSSQPQSASPKNPLSPYEKPGGYAQNGPVSNFPNSPNSGQGFGSPGLAQVNGHGAPGGNNTLFPPPTVSQPGQWPPTSPKGPPEQSQKLSASSMGGASPMQFQYQAAGPLMQSSGSDNKTVPKMSQVPSPGLPMPYGSQNAASSSPMVTPGASQPPSARSSRNPSPISTQRYDYMEGQFSNKPSPANSTVGSQNLGISPAPTSNAYSPNPRNSIDGGQPMQNLYPGQVGGGTPYSTPSNSAPFSPNTPAPGFQPQGPGMTPGSSIPPQAGPVRQRYPQQLGYNQASQYASPVLNQPTSMPPPSNSMSNTSPQPPPFFPQQNQSPHLPPMQPQQQSPYPQQYGGSLPDGPVGGLAGYDPQLHAKMAGMSVHGSFSRLWGNESINLLQDRNILPPVPIEPPKPVLNPDRPNCSPSIFRCTLTKIPDTSSLLQKSRLPFGVLIHPFKDVDSLTVITCNTIVRCRSCRTYINPFVSFIDQRRWKCNLCFRINDLPEEFLFDPATRSYGDPARRPEIKNATIEFIAPSDYMLRPPQPAVYLFVLDVSHSAVENGYLAAFCKILLDNLADLPGDSRTRVGFITFDGSIHFYNLGEGINQPHMLIVSDVEDVFLPSPDNLLVNLHESKALIADLLNDLPKRFAHSSDINSCLGAALQAAYKLMAPVGGRVTVLQTCLPNYGPGALKNREDPNMRAAKDVSNIGPATDFYKKLALDCSGQQIAVDLFLLSSQFIDIATVGCISKYSSGSVHYYPGYHHQMGRLQVEKFAGDLQRYLTRRIGFEAVMRIRCTRGLTIHTFHGNFFVRSTDLLSLPNVNPDSGYGMQISIEENLTDSNSVCFQAAVLYTSSSGERRIRVHTLSLPVVSILQDVLGGADQETIVGLIAKMAVDRSITSSLSDARDALINVCIDVLGVYKLTVSGQVAGALMTPYSTRLLPLFILALLKHVAFRTGVSTKLDERVYAMELMKSLPLTYLIKYIYPSLYPVHALDEKNAIHQDDDVIIPQPVILQLSSEKVDRHGAYILDTLDVLYLYVGRAISDQFCVNVLNVPNFSAIPDDMMSLPELATPESERMRAFVAWLQDQRPFHSPLKIIREDSKDRFIFLQYMIDDRTESLFSYYEFLQHIRQQISK